jgi:hypothetical protein
MKQPLSDFERQLEILMRKLGHQGMLDNEIIGKDVDSLLTTAPVVSPSSGFARRAMETMAKAQWKREQENPAIALGTTIARARRMVRLGTSEIANQIGVAARALEALESGELSVRQILHNFPPLVMTRLLSTVKLANQEFSARLMDLAVHGRTASGNAIPQLAYRHRRTDSDSPIKEVAEYLAAVEHLTQSE